MLNFSSLHSSSPLWRIDPQLIHDPTFSEYLYKQIKLCFKPTIPQRPPQVNGERLKILFEGLYDLLFGVLK